MTSSLRILSQNVAQFIIYIRVFPGSRLLLTVIDVDHYDY